MPDRVGSQSLVATALAQVSLMEEQAVSLSETSEIEVTVFFVIIFTFFSSVVFSVGSICVKKHSIRSFGTVMFPRVL